MQLMCSIFRALLIIGSLDHCLGGRKETPHIFVCTVVRNAEPILPYFFGQFEHLDYPKRRLTVYLATDGHNIDDTADMVTHWADAVRPLYNSVLVDTVAGSAAPDHEQQAAVTRDACARHAADLGAEHVLHLDTDALLTDVRTIRQLVAAGRPVVAPALRPADWGNRYSNFAVHSKRLFDTILDRTDPEKDTYRVAAVSSCYLVNMSAANATRLSHDYRQLTEVASLKMDAADFSHMDTADVFSASAVDHSVRLYVSNAAERGYDFGFLLPFDGEYDDYNDYVETVEKVIADRMTQTRTVLHSPHLKPKATQKSLGVDHLYVVNLKHRRKRWNRMKRMLTMLGIAFTRWPATSGYSLTVSDFAQRNASVLRGYANRYDGRTLTLGEAALFFTSHRLWQEAAASGHKRIVVLEDDAVLMKGFARRLRQVTAALDADAPLQWDIIYLAAYSMDGNFRSVHVDQFDHPELKTCGFTVWAVAYMLSATGLQKLIDSKPLEKMIPVDEYFSIMSDKHPNEEWKSHFANRDLIAYKVDPPLAAPLFTKTSDRMFRDRHYSDTSKSPTVDTILIDTDRKIPTVTTKSEL